MKREEHIPRDFRLARQRLEAAFPGDKPKQFENTYLYLRRKRNEKEEYYWRWRLETFREWLLTGENLDEHIKTDMWALKEFKRRRKKIRRTLKSLELKQN